MLASGPPIGGYSPATRYWASLTVGPEDSLQAMEVDDSVPWDDNVTRAEVGSLCIGL